MADTSWDNYAYNAPTKETPSDTSWDSYVYNAPTVVPKQTLAGKVSEFLGKSVIEPAMGAVGLKEYSDVPATAIRTFTAPLNIIGAGINPEKYLEKSAVPISTGHQVAKEIAALAGMAAPYALGYGVASKLVGGTGIAREALRQAGAMATYGQLSHTPEGEGTRLEQLERDVLTGAAFGAAGGVAQKAAARFIPSVSSALTKEAMRATPEIVSPLPFTPSERIAKGVLPYMTSGTLMAGAGAAEPADTLEERARRAGLGFLVGAGAHGVSEGIGAFKRGVIPETTKPTDLMAGKSDMPIEAESKIEGLRPIMKTKETGELVMGEPGQTHQGMIDAGVASSEGKRGFITPEGIPLNLSEAMKWAIDNHEGIAAYLTPNEAGNLHAENYNQAFEKWKAESVKGLPESVVSKQEPTGEELMRKYQQDATEKFWNDEFAKRDIKEAEQEAFKQSPLGAELLQKQLREQQLIAIPQRAALRAEQENRQTREDVILKARQEAGLELTREDLLGQQEQEAITPFDIQSPVEEIPSTGISAVPKNLIVPEVNIRTVPEVKSEPLSIDKLVDVGKEGAVSIEERVALLRRTGQGKAADKLEGIVDMTRKRKPTELGKGTFGAWINTVGGFNVGNRRGELKMAMETNPALKFVNKKGEFSEDQLAQMGYDAGWLKDNDVNTFWEALNNPQHKSILQQELSTEKEMSKMQREQDSKTKIAQKLIEEFYNPERKIFTEDEVNVVYEGLHGQKSKEDIVKRINELGKTVEGVDNTWFTPSQQENIKKTPTQVDMLGAEGFDISGSKLPEGVPVGETQLERAVRENNEAKSLAEQNKKQGNLPIDEQAANLPIQSAEGKVSGEGEDIVPLEVPVQNPVNDNILMLKQKLNNYLGDNGDILRLAGQGNTGVRAELLSIIEGKEVPKTKAGVTILERRLFEIAGIDTENMTKASQNESLREWRKTQQISEAGVGYGENIGDKVEQGKYGELSANKGEPEDKYSKSYFKEPKRSIFAYFEDPGGKGETNSLRTTPDYIKETIADAESKGYKYVGYRETWGYSKEPLGSMREYPEFQGRAKGENVTLGGGLGGAYEEITKIIKSGEIQKAYGHVVDIAKNFYEHGKTTFKQFNDNMKEFLGDAYGHVKDLVTRAYTEVKNAAIRLVKEETGAIMRPSDVWAKIKEEKPVSIEKMGSKEEGIKEKGGFKIAKIFQESEQGKQIKENLKEIKDDFHFELKKEGTNWFKLPKTIMKDFQILFAPGTISDRAAKTEGFVRRYNSLKDSVTSAIAHRDSKAVEAWYSIPKEDKVRFIVNYEENAKLPGEIGNQARAMRKSLEDAFKLQDEAGIGKGWIKDYFPHMFEHSAEMGEWLDKKINSLGSDPYTREREIRWLRDAIDKGFQLKETNPVKAVQNRVFSAYQAVAKENLMKTLTGNGIALEEKPDMWLDAKEQTTVATAQAKDAWNTADARIKSINEKINDIKADREAFMDARKGKPMTERQTTDYNERIQSWQDKIKASSDTINDAKKYFKLPKSNTTDDFIDRITVNGKSYLLPKDVSPVFKNSLLSQQESLWTKETTAGEAYRTLMQAKNVLVPLKLLSAFHAIHIATMAGPSRRAAILEHLIKGGKSYDGMLKDFLKGSAFVDQGYKAGKEASEAWKVPEEQRTPAQRDMVALMVDGGHSPEMSAEYKINMKERVKKALLENKKGLAGIYSLPAIVETIQKPLMEKYIPNIKNGAYLYEAKLLLDRRPELLKNDAQRYIELGKIAKSVENRFGELNYSNLFWNKLIKEVGIGSSLSLGWNLGFVREFGGAAVDFGKLISNLRANKGKTFREDISRRMLFTLDYSVQSMILGGLITYALTGDKDIQLQDLTFPRTGAKNSDGTDERLTTPFYTKEFPAWLEHIREEGPVGGQIAWMKNKANPAVSDLIKIWNNKDFYGTEIRGMDDHPIKQIGQVAAFIGKSFMPIAAAGYTRGKEMDSVSQYTGLLGFNIAPSYASRSKALQELADLRKSHTTEGTRTKEQFEHTREKQLLKQKLRQSGDTSIVRDAMKEKTITAQEGANIIRNSHLTVLQEGIKSSSISHNEALKVWNKATDAEKGEIRMYMIKKMHSIKNMLPEQRTDMLAKYREVRDWKPE